MSTNRDGEQACNAVVNVYARTQLRLSLVPKATLTARGAQISIAVQNDILRGSVAIDRSFARLFAPLQDLSALIKRGDITRDVGADWRIEV